MRCIGEQFVSYPQLSLHFRQHPSNVTVPCAPRSGDWQGTLPATCSPEDLAQLASTSAHALRHTFGTQAIRQMPVNVVQAILGHTSLQTTSIYTRAGRQQMLDAAERHYSADAPSPGPENR
ncbi:tyrosine-type recombinase/integrase (plasmid) [Paraburkholderia ginsengisoli]|uniref:Tyrosine-type recombinase/integrase n=1 Tax=Paraburkholderia ginsengisoli TaxID=311231 RepID=A0A7T4TC61_9BURK|nr:tyrosine-type recombinase/integrase [Paraburkholderia ginsengisoli]